MKVTSVLKRLVVVLASALVVATVHAPSTSAQVVSHSLSIDSPTDSIELGDTATAVLTHSWVNLDSAYDSVSIRAIVTSSNAATAGVIQFSVTDSYTSTANDATTANSPRYSYGSQSYIDSLTIADSLTSSTYRTAATPHIGWVRINDASSVFLTTNYSSLSARDSLTISPGASDSVTAGVSSRTQGTQLQVRLYNPTAAGTYVISVYTQEYSANAAVNSTNTPSVTWTVTVTEPTRTAAANSSVTLRTGAISSDSGNFWAGTREGGDSGTVAAATSSATDVTEEFSLIVLQKSSVATNTARESYTVTVSGEAYVTDAGTTVSTRPTANSGGLKSVRMAVATAGTATRVEIWSTGTAGTATVTVTTDSGLVLGTKTLTFHGTIAGIEKVATYKNVIRSGVTTGSTSVIAVKAVDSAGRGVTGVSIAGVSSNLNAIASGTCTDNISYAGTAADVSTRDGTFFCDLTQSVSSASGQAATITWRVLKYLSTTEYWTVTQDVTMGGAFSTFTIKTDKATYEPGENMVITVTAKDASGNTPYDLQDGPTLAVNKQTGGTCTIGSLLGGVATSSGRDALGDVVDAKRCFAPAASGKFIISGQDAQTVPATVTATATIGDDAATAAAAAATDAALEAIDAANAATDAANLAAEAADAATVAAEEARDAADAATAAVDQLAKDIVDLAAGIKAQITTLANTVAKIAKKVKA